MGNKNKKGELNIPATKRNHEFEELCKLSQVFTKLYVLSELRKLGYEDVAFEDGFVFAQGTHPVLLVAHMDTVHKDQCKDIVYDGNKISSPQGIGGDDRCGIYMILKIAAQIKCSILFTEDEEIGCVGAGKFAKTEYVKTVKESCNYIVEFDRKGTKDAVFYYNDNKDFEKFVTESGDFKTAYGSYSDIVDISPVCEISSVNLSCGYEKAHTTAEYVDLDVMEENIGKAIALISKESSKFEYIECKHSYYDGIYGDYYGSYYDNYYDNYYGDYYKSYKKPKESVYLIEFINSEKNFKVAEVKAVSEEEAVGKFLMDQTKLTYESIKYVLNCEEDDNSAKKKEKEKVNCTMFDNQDNTFYCGNWEVEIEPEVDGEEQTFYNMVVSLNNYVSGSKGIYTAYYYDEVEADDLIAFLNDITIDEATEIASIITNQIDIWNYSYQ